MTSVGCGERVRENDRETPELGRLAGRGRAGRNGPHHESTRVDQRRPRAKAKRVRNMGGPRPRSVPPFEAATIATFDTCVKERISAGSMRSREAAQRVRHDLGKYVHLEARWLGEDADAAEYRDALRTDLLRTRRGPTGDEDCLTLWTRLRPTVLAFDLREVDDRVARIGALLPLLDELDLARLRQLAREAHELGEACRRLVEQAED